MGAGIETIWERYDQAPEVKITDFDLIPVARKFLKYAPGYAMDEARQAIFKVHELKAQGFLRNGVYYVVLCDIVGATATMAELGNEGMAARIQTFITTSLNSISQANLSNVVAL